MDLSQEKSLFLHRERDVWDRLAEEGQSRERLAEKLATANPELADLQSREAEARKLAWLAIGMLQSTEQERDSACQAL